MRNTAEATTVSAARAPAHLPAVADLLDDPLPARAARLAARRRLRQPFLRRLPVDPADAAAWMAAGALFAAAAVLGLDSAPGALLLAGAALAGAAAGATAALGVALSDATRAVVALIDEGNLGEAVWTEPAVDSARMWEELLLAASPVPARRRHLGALVADLERQAADRVLAAEAEMVKGPERAADIREALVAYAHAVADPSDRALRAVRLGIAVRRLEEVLGPR